MFGSKLSEAVQSSVGGSKVEQGQTGMPYGRATVLLEGSRVTDARRLGVLESVVL
jgi:hypothetical protein